MGSMQFSYGNNKDDVTLEQASETIRKDTKGKVLSATTSYKNGIKSHRIQVLTKSGRVKVYQVPANKNQTPKRYENRSDRPNNSNNYRNKTPNNDFSNHNNTKKQPPQSRPHYSRNSSKRINSIKPKKPSGSNKNGDTKKK